MVEYTGNSMPAPGYKRGDYTTDDELLFSHDHNYVQKGVTLKPGQGVLPLGTALQYDSASKKYVKATSVGNALGLLRKTTDTGTDPNGQVWLANILYGGVVKLAAVSTANSGIGLTNLLGGRVNAQAGFFKF